MRGGGNGRRIIEKPGALLGGAGWTSYRCAVIEWTEKGVKIIEKRWLQPDAGRVDHRMTRGHPSPLLAAALVWTPLSWFLLEISQLANDQIGAFRLLPSSLYTSCLWISVSPLARPLTSVLSSWPDRLSLSISHSLSSRERTLCRSPVLSPSRSLSLSLSNLRPPPVHPVARSAGHVCVFISPTLRQWHDRPAKSFLAEISPTQPDQWSKTFSNYYYELSSKLSLTLRLISYFLLFFFKETLGNLESRERSIKRRNYIKFFYKYYRLKY